MRIVECVPNFSEGRDRAKIEAITKEIEGVAGAQLLDVDPGADTNRTVVTFAGTPEAVEEAAFRAIKKAIEVIDMTRHKGAHPRIGAADVCPFVPVAGVSMEECAAIAERLGERVGSELGVPVYLYEHAATTPERRSLAHIREGEYEGLREKLQRPEWAPDFGPATFNPKAGAVVIGAREFLIAYNVNLNTRDKRLAHEIALGIRDTGRTKRDEDGNILRNADGTALRVPGKLEAVRAVGWYIDEYKQAQVSMNLMSYHITSLHAAFEAVREEAEKLGLIVTGSEIVGLVPLEPLLEAGRYFLRKQGKSHGMPEPYLIDVAVRSLGLNQLHEFDPKRKVIEYRLMPLAPLGTMRLSEFVNEVSTDSPAPGGGSVAALCGSLGAALVSMVANIAASRKGSDLDILSRLAASAQGLKDELLRSVDRDAGAFNAVLDAMRLPRRTEEQTAAREIAVQSAYRHAAEVPLATADLCLKALALSREAAMLGDDASISDAGVAALTAWSGIEGAALNVLINLREIQDEEFCASMRRRVDEMRHRALGLRDEVLRSLGERLL
ncbi:MAG: glutamate formimidoyltransferase [Candidatus Thermoplasmatota archaeon]